jgi:hypothetical protein
MTAEDSRSRSEVEVQALSVADLGEASRESLESLKAQASDPALTEDAALHLLQRSDLPGESLEHISRNSTLVKSRKVKLALVSHPMTPRHVSLPIVRHLYTFDLMRVTLTPVTPADIKVAADEALIARLEKITPGEKLSLAKRASGRVASGLLNDPDTRVIEAVLENPRLTEAALVKALAVLEVKAELTGRICEHPKWSLRHEVRVALLRTGKIPLSKALDFARGMAVEQVREILENSRLPEDAKDSLLDELGAAVQDRSSDKPQQ